MSEPWHDGDMLDRLYWGEGMTQQEIGEQLGCTRKTIRRWMRENNIESRQSAQKPYQDEEKLRELYHEKEMSTHEIGDIYCVSSGTIHQQMQRYGVELRSKSQANKLNEMPPELVESGAPEWVYEKMRKGPATYFTSKKGYEMCVAHVGDEQRWARVHQLVAIANGADPELVFDGDHHIHHRNNIPWDNRPCNVELMTASEHSRHHALKSDDAV